MILEKARFEAQLACREYEWHMSIKVNIARGAAPSLGGECPELFSVVSPSKLTVSLIVCLFAVSC